MFLLDPDLNRPPGEDYNRNQIHHMTPPLNARALTFLLAIVNYAGTKLMLDIYDSK